MRTLTLLALFSAVTFAADEKDHSHDEAEPKQTPREAAISRMLSERDSPEKLAKAIEDAKKEGATDQSLLEARFLFLVDRREDKAIVALLPEFLKHKDTFKLEDSEIFAVKEDWLAVIEYVEALDKLQKGDSAGFKRHILEAFWLSPRQGAAFAPHIDRLRMEEAMRSIRFNFDIALTPLNGTEKVNLKTLSEGRKGTLFMFWSPWSKECEETLPDFLATTKELKSKGISVAAILSENSPTMLKQARGIVAKLGAKPPGTWLIDDEKQPLNQLFRVQSIPLMVLLSPDGKVLFNGSPTDDELWTQLTKISPDIKRPPLVDGDKKGDDKAPAKHEH